MQLLVEYAQRLNLQNIYYTVRKHPDVLFSFTLPIPHSIRPNLLILFPEHPIEPTQAAFAVKRRIFQVLRQNAQRCDDMLLDQPQPFHLFCGKMDRTGVAAESPLFEL